MKKVLITTDYYIPAFKAGGPTRSVFNLSKMLSGKFELDIFTSSEDIDRSLLNLSLIKEGAKVNTWIVTDYARIFYMSSFCKFFSIFKKKINRDKYDIIYLNSFFSFRYSIIFVFLVLIGWLKCERLIIAPRGELTPGAMKNKLRKKRMYLKLFNTIKFLLGRNRLFFHFTSKEELDDSFFYLGKVNYKLAPNMHEDAPPFLDKYKSVGDLKIVFISRISQKKNLLTICKSISRIEHGNIDFKIAGNVEDESYWLKCLSILESAPSNIHFEYLGSLDRKGVWDCLAKSHLFVLPTYNENYGHSIVEGMISSNLVLISDKTPWSQVSTHGSGVYEPDDYQSYENYIIKILGMDNEEFNNASRATYLYCYNALNSNVELVEEVFNV